MQELTKDEIKNLRKTARKFLNDKSKSDEKKNDGRRFLDKFIIFSEFDEMKSLLELSKF